MSADGRGGSPTVAASLYILRHHRVRELPQRHVKPILEVAFGEPLVLRNGGFGLAEVPHTLRVEGERLSKGDAFWASFTPRVEASAQPLVERVSLLAEAV
jgi:hypothetical protein